jgi:CBS domain-containing protein
MSSRDLGKLAVGDLKEDAQVVDSDTPISKIIGLLREWNAYSVFTQRGDKVGVISIREILKVANITNRKTASIITYVPKLDPTERVGRAAEIMEEHRVRTLPITANREIVGQITAEGIGKALDPQYLKKYKIKSIMTSNPIVISADDPVNKARSLMARRKIDHLPVTDNGKLAGITTSAHIVLKMLPSHGVETGALGAEKQNRFDYPLRRIMDTDVVTCDAEDKISDVLEKMQSRQSTYAIALLWSEIQGIVTYGDFLKLIAAEKSHLEIPVYIVGLPEDPFEAEATRDKFLRTISGLRRAFPDIIEARSIIKTKEIRGDRRRYEVSVSLRTPTDTHSYTEGGYDLPSIYDVLIERMKRLLPQRSRRTNKPTRRRAEG